MNVLTCAQVRLRLIRALQSDQASVLAPDVREHLEACPICQTALLLINTLALPKAPEPIDCASCQNDLAAFVECERELGWHTAQRADPNVWWHVWTCADCSETYDLLQVVVAAQQRGELALPAQLTPAAQPSVSLAA